MGESEELGDVVCVDEVVDVDPAAHGSTLGHPLFAGTGPGAVSRRASCPGGHQSAAMLSIIRYSIGGLGGYLRGCSG